MQSAFLEGSMITALSNLLKLPNDDSDSDDEKPKGGVSSLGPGDIGGKSNNSSNASSKIKTLKKNTGNKDIWDPDEVTAGAEYDDTVDPREQPEYDIVYRQSVAPEDMFLQLGNKTTATSSCEDMIVKVKLPGSTLVEVQLDVKETFLDCRTPKYKLGLFLPHPVDAKNAKAQWDSDAQTLSVTLRLNRLLDFVNF
jgi:hypothetical protein